MKTSRPSTINSFQSRNQNGSRLMRRAIMVATIFAVVVSAAFFSATAFVQQQPSKSKDAPPPIQSDVVHLFSPSSAAVESVTEGTRETTAPAGVPVQAATSQNLTPHAPNTTTLISPTGDGGFETGADLTANGWTTVNNATNGWFVGTATFSAGTKSVYVSNTSGATYAYNNTTAAVSHFYRDITVPAGENAILLSFKLKGDGDFFSPSFFDKTMVYTAPTSFTPTTAAPASPGTSLPGATLVYAQAANFGAAYATQSVLLPQSLAGTTFRLIFTWHDDTSTGTVPSSIDEISLTSAVLTPLTGAKTIDNTMATAGNNYNNFTDAINDLNLNGIGAGGVTFNVTSGQTFSELPPTIAATGTAGNPIVFIKSGALANPIVQGTTGIGTVDACIAIAGGDFITFDGIDALDNPANATNTTRMEYGFLIRNASGTNGALNNTIQNTSITLNRANTASIGILQTSEALGGGVTPTTTGGGNSNNHYYNLTIQNAYSGVYLRTLSVGPDTSNEVGVTGAGTTVIGGAAAGDIGGGATTTWGIRAIAQTNVKIFKTEVRNVSVTAGVALDGIFLDQLNGTNECFANQVHDIRNTSTSATTAMSGIKSNTFTTSGPVIRLYNNFVWNITSGYTGAATATRQIKGISVQSAGGGLGTFQNIDFNSVRLDGSGSPNISSSAFAIGSTSGPVINVRNNIFVNATGAQAGVAKHYTWESTSATLTGIAGSISDHNDLFIANTTNGFVGLGNTTDRATITDWRTATGQDFHSKSSDPQFNSATDLHINPAVATEVESAGSYFNGAITWVPQDIDLQARNATFPDIGADEGTFTAAADTTFPDIFFTAVPQTANTTSRTLTAKILDPSGVPTAGTGLPVLYFRKGVAGAFTAVQGVSTGSGNYDFTITYAAVGGVVVGDVIQYYFVAQDNVNNVGSNPIVGAAGFSANPPTATTPPTTPFSYTIAAAFTGAVSVGSAETITSLTNAGGLFAQMNAGVVTGNVVVSITSNLAAEAGTVALNQFVEEPAGSNFTITIKPSGAARTITGAGAGVNLIKLNGADRVTIDGSLSGGTDRSLTISNPFASTSASVVWLASVASPANGANNNTIKNCIITGASSTTTVVGIATSGSVLGGVAEAANSNNTIQNNAVTAVGTGMFAVGPSGNETGNTITGNDVGSTIVASKIGTNGIAVFQQANATVSNNTITGVVTATSTTAAGIRSAGTADAVLISRNKITDIKNTNGTGFGSNGIQLQNSVVAGPVTIANNFISDVASVGFAGVAVGDNGYGIIAVTGGGYNIYDNSINLATNQTAAGSITAGINITSAITIPSAIDLRGNIFSNTETVGTRYGIYVAAALNVISTINYNDYFAQNVGFLGVARPAITDWRTATGQDVNSIAADPTYISATDLHIPPTSPVVGAGTPIAGITTDIDNDPRPASNPDIGADELVQAVAGVIPAGTYYNVASAASGTDTLGGDVTVTGTLWLSGILSTGTNTLTIDCNGTVTGASPTVYIIGNLRKNYCAAGVKGFEVGTASGYSPVSVNATAGTFPANFTVKAVQGPQPNVNAATSLKRYWTLTEGGSVTANLQFNYLDPTDIMGTEANYHLIRVIGGVPAAFPNGSCPTPAANTACVDTAGNQASINGVTEFSDWTLGEITVPTAAPATISGQVTTTSGAPLAGVTMYLSGARSGRAISDGQGNYRFAGVDTDNFYTVTPAIANFHFSPASRSFSLIANKTDAVFTGTLDDSITRNVIDTPEYFVRQHYLDFLGREPDQAGLAFWSDQLISCGNDYNCVERRTINVSAAYFLSIEFKETGGLVAGLYRTSYGRRPLYSEFVPDTGIVGRDVIVGNTGWQGQLATNKQQFLDAWVQRADFRAAYDNLANDSYVDQLISHTHVVFPDGERTALLDGLNNSTLSRAAVLGRIAQNEGFVKAKLNETFVMMEYFGYLRRDPDDSGFHYWLDKLNEFEGNFERAEMVRAFIVSSEYRDRFRQ